ncbi:beta-glucosidase 24-like [Lotus japonicus]|uniref:beta-glucosidase 24-like n=1 Tax=Lotus japonicus TaxID=34305 RepID=UPI0025893AF0|nr:beta-glucosidase 24-like [Lotus japonicus]
MTTKEACPPPPSQNRSAAIVGKPPWDGAVAPRAASETLNLDLDYDLSLSHKLKLLSHGTSPHVIRRRSFPADFLFGAGTSALQVEGSQYEGGRGPSVWDDIIRDADKYPTMIEHYKRYKEDVALLKKLGVNSYRFSIAWSRILPDGTLNGGINQEGINFYNNLINELLANGITPFVTILHFDYPLHLYKQGGFLNISILNHYKDYSDLLFKTYGDRVKHWATFNEQEITAMFNFMHGMQNPSAEKCQVTKECKEAYLFIHNSILCHATAANIYNQKYKATQGGEIGIVLCMEDYIPYSFKPEDVAASERLSDFFSGWILEPLFYGDYPTTMRELVGDRLPIFTEEEKILVKGSIDFIGLNYYRSFYARNEPNKTRITNLDNYDSLAVKEVINAQGKTIGFKDPATSSFIYPEGLYNVLIHLKQKYQNPKIYITENGISSGKIVNSLEDSHRINYIAAHLNYTKFAIDSGVNVGGYFAWAAFDTFEFYGGFSDRFGLISIDFNDNLKRIPKWSARWYKWFLTGNKNF